ncbi:hypothetical protein [Streptomyces yaizuensis]|uniref:Uncharacterized protein n=1 Tax=Streptomyces yaizuensis TaxID=2989713 RepID=A0ABQ5P972_9ACTN|nr:hypothetical protein [Streptomyces sp. YSPA8]GLF99107.1 hypothetical protein SYYSPA8_32440 [Streptomyces sp. YSPA8]
MPLYEIRTGVFASPAVAAEVAGEFRRFLTERAVPCEQSVVGPDEPTPDAVMTVAELYEELPEQWAAEHPGEAPGERRVHEIRTGVLLPSREDVAGLPEELTGLLCPDSQHSGPCAVPWTAGYPTSEEEAEEAEAEEAATGTGGEEPGRPGRRLGEIYGGLTGAR